MWKKIGCRELVVVTEQVEEVRDQLVRPSKYGKVGKGCGAGGGVKEEGEV